MRQQRSENEVSGLGMRQQRSENEVRVAGNETATV